MIRDAATYCLLTVYALLTLVPFVYMASSSIKPRSVFFNAPFLPNDGLFAIDPATAALRVVDVTLLPDAPGVAQVFTLAIEMRLAGETVAAESVRVGYGDVDPDTVDLLISSEPVVNTDVGRVAISPPPNAESSDQVAYTYVITEGNPHGVFHTAWGLLTADNFHRLFFGVPRSGSDGAESFEPTGVWRATVNSFFFASVTSVLATLGAAMGGYALAKFRFAGRAAIDYIVLAALVIPGALLIAPGYKVLYHLGLLDSYVGLILPGLAPAFGVFLFRQAFRASLPDEMLEAARIDGCGEVRIFFTICVPMVRPMLGAFLLITYLGAWNNFLGPQVVLQTPEKYPLAVWIGQLRGVYGIDYGLIMAGTLVAIAPVLLLFLLLQKEFIAGLTSGAVKG